MSRLQALIDAANQGKSDLERLYGPFPLRIAAQCGPDEIQESIEWLDKYVVAWHAVECDGDAQDDYWRLMKGMRQLLEALVPRFPLEVAAALRSEQTGTRIRGAIVFRNQPSATAIEPLQEAIRVEKDDRVRSVLRSALAACDPERGTSAPAAGARPQSPASPAQCSQATTWLLVDGAPPGPRNLGLDEITSAQGPPDFLRRLFADLCGTSALPTHVTVERVVPSVERVASGFCGTREVGYRWVEEECLETSAIPYRVYVETHGLPGVEVRWHYHLDHAGQAGHAAFRHASLKARFADATAERRFTEVWQSVFGTVPRWEAAPEQ